MNYMNVLCILKFTLLLLKFHQKLPAPSTLLGSMSGAAAA